MPDASSPHIKLDGDDPRIERIFATHRFVPLNLYDEITKLAEYAIGEIIEEQNNLVEQLQTERQARAEAEGRMRGYMRIDEERSAQKKYLMEQLEAALRAVDAARVILTLADEERDELAGEVSKYLGPWADLVEAVHAVSNPALRPS